MKTKIRTKLWLQLGLVVSLVIVAFVAWHTMKALAPEPKKKPREVLIPVVEAIEINKQTVRLEIPSQGTILPRTQTNLVAEVSGRVVEISPSLDEGGAFTEGEILLVIDPRDYEMAMVQAEADLASAEAGLEQEKARAKQAKEDWSRLGDGEQPALSARIPQLKEAQAKLKSAWAMLQNAETNLERTRIIAPYDGRSREKFADIGQFLTRGAQIAEIFATDYAEVRLPLRNQQLALVDLPFQYKKQSENATEPSVSLSANFGKRVLEWEGKVVRTEAVMNTEDRMLYAIARIDDPYNLEGKHEAPLPVGLFVEAKIEGVELKDVFVLPKLALRENNTIHVVTKDSSLDIVQVDPLHTDTSYVYIGSKLEAGNLVSLSPLEAPVVGMQLSIRSSETKSGKNNQVKVAQSPSEE
ncbi:MAG: efflux RND transporter periplasmic adaptor subunit [Verrucomicrobiota bacterium]